MYNIPQEMIDEFNEKMKHISENQWRTEDAHIEMDNVMCNTLRKLGFEKGIDIFEHTERWYS